MQELCSLPQKGRLALWEGAHPSIQPAWTGAGDEILATPLSSPPSSYGPSALALHDYFSAAGSLIHRSCPLQKDQLLERAKLTFPVPALPHHNHN